MRKIHWLALPAGFALAFFRLWTCLCFFPAQEWNDVRLRPAFLIADGLPLYAGLDAGPITTWIYGPVLPLLMTPVALARTIDSALLLAGAGNALILAGGIAFACLLWPPPADHRWTFPTRLAALGISLLLLPLSFFIFLQADNAALTCGLVSLTCLARAQRQNNRPWGWLAAGFAVAAAFSKLHGSAVVVGEIAWLWMAASRTHALRHTGRLLVAGGLWSGVTLALSASPGAAWEAMVIIPSRLPFSGEWLTRLAPLAPYYLLMVVVPALLARDLVRRPRLESSGLGLPVCAWLVSLPLGIAGTLTSGGSCNSLHAAFFVIPIALLGRLSRPNASPRRRWLSVPATGLIALALLLVWQVQGVVQLPKTPQLSLAVEATALSARFAERLWLPWRPLATRYATGRHDHDEDGLYVRQLTGLFPKRAHAFAHLPPEWDRTLFQRVGMNWQVARAMHSPTVKMYQFSGWLLFTEPAADSGVGNGPPQVHTVR